MVGKLWKFSNRQVQQESGQKASFASAGTSVVAARSIPISRGADTANSSNVPSNNSAHPASLPSGFGIRIVSNSERDGGAIAGERCAWPALSTSATASMRHSGAGHGTSACGAASSRQHSVPMAPANQDKDGPCSRPVEPWAGVPGRLPKPGYGPR